MGFSTLTPLDELGLKAGCSPFLATYEDHLLFGRVRCSIGQNTDAMRLQLAGNPFLGIQSPCGLGLRHGLDVDLRIELSRECEIPTFFDLEEHDVVHATQMPTLRRLALRALQKLLPSRFACVASLVRPNV